MRLVRHYNGRNFHPCSGHGSLAARRSLMYLPAMPHRSRSPLLFAIVLFACLNAPRAAAAETSLVMTSEPNSNFGSPQSYAYTPADGTFGAQVNYQSGVSLTFNGSSAYWYLDFANGPGQSLRVGLYPDAVEFPTFSLSTPQLRVSGSGGSCSSITGAFRVKQIVYDGPAVTSLWAVFEQRCGSATGLLRGEIRYNADVPV